MNGFIKTFLISLLLMCTSAVSFAQNKVTIRCKNQTLREVMESIKKQTSLSFAFTDNIDADRIRITAEISDTDLKAALEKILKPYGITFVLMDKQILLNPVKTEEISDLRKKVEVKGKVTDDSGNPIIGAVVKIKNGDVYSISDESGNYSIETMYDDVLVFSSIGYSESEISVRGRSILNVVMEEDVQMLEDVVVTGYQTISKERVTGSFVKINSENMETRRLNSLSSVLEGNIAGYNDGKIRGVTSMNGMTTPLYVIDGFPVEKTTNDGYGNWVESVPDLNIEDIESITVLKDAAATSIYGARAANGVIVITTKKAGQNKFDISFSATLTAQPYHSYADKYLADASTMIDLEKEWASQNPNLSGSNVQSYAQNLLDNMSYQTLGIRNILNYYAGHISESEMNLNLDELSGMGYNYYDDVARYGKRTAFQQQYNLSIRKGSENNSFSASATYIDNKLEDIYSDNKSIGINLQNSTNITKWLSLDLGTYLNYGSGTTQNYSLLSPGYTYMPYSKLMNEDGTKYVNTEEDRYSITNLNTLHSNGLYNLDITPLDEIGYDMTDNKDFSNRSYARLTFKFTDCLKYSAAFQYEYAEYKTEQFQDKNSYTVKNKVNSFATRSGDETVFNLPYGNIYKSGSNTTRAYNFRQQLDFNKTFGNVHEVVALVGTETRENKMNYISNTFYNYDPDLLSFSMIDANQLSTTRGLWGWGYFSSSDVAFIRELVNRYVSFYGNASYTYDGKYTFSGSIRWDKTNLFSTGSKYQNKPIWSVGGGWNIYREKFFDVSWVDMLKLRASYGIGGNIAKDSAPYMTAYYTSNTNVGGISGTIQSRPNPDLSWEKTTTLNIGLDFSLLDNRLGGNVDYYYKAGTDLLANTNGVPVEGWGYSTYTINNGEMINTGFELTLYADAVKTKNWTWNISGVFGYNKNEVTYVNVEAPASYLLIDYPSAYPRIGNPYNAIYGYQWAGLSASGNPQVYDADGNLFTDMTPSEMEDLIYLGTTVPVYSGSINTNLRFRNWELAAQFLFEGGHKMRNTNIAYLSGMAPVAKNIENRWKQPGDEAFTDIPRYVSSESPDYNYNYYNMYARSSVNVIDAFNCRFDKLSLIYRVPKSFCEKFKLQGARLMFGMENIYTWAKSEDAKYLLGGYVKPSYIFGLYLNL